MLQTLLADVHSGSPSRWSASAGNLSLVTDELEPGRCFSLFRGIYLARKPLLWMENVGLMHRRLAKGHIGSLEEEPLLL